jgi:hypothetical protein
MSETENLPVAPPEPPPPPKPEAVTPAKPRQNFWPALGVAGFLLLAAGEGYLYRLHLLIPDNSTAIAVLQAQVAGLTEYANRAQPAPDSITVQADLAQKFADLNAQVTAMQNQVATDHATLSTLTASSVDITKLTAKITLLNQLENARMALDAGQPVGNIPNAPPALAVFATAPPPTLAALVLSFPAAAQAAETVSVERVQGVSFWSRVLARLEGLVTITNGAHVVVGAPAAAIIEQARTLLNAGDLNGAVAVLGGLSPTTQAAMGDWLTQARDLLAARAAIITMAGQS